jgi:hypothetical protein
MSSEFLHLIKVQQIHNKFWMLQLFCPLFCEMVKFCPFPSPNMFMYPKAKTGQLPWRPWNWQKRQDLKSNSERNMNFMKIWGPHCTHYEDYCFLRCSMEDTYWYFRRIWCLHLQYFSTRLHSIKSQKTNLFMDSGSQFRNTLLCWFWTSPWIFVSCGNDCLLTVWRYMLPPSSGLKWVE